MLSPEQRAHTVQFPHQEAQEIEVDPADEEVRDPSIPELAREAGLSESFLYQRARLGSLPGAYRIGPKLLRVRRRDFYRALRSGQIK